MSSLNGSSGPSTSRNESLPVRSSTRTLSDEAGSISGRSTRTPDSSRSTNTHNDECVRNAVITGKNISGRVADMLRQSSLAGDHESNLHSILTLAEDLHNYQSPVEFTIGLVGDSGVGKSSLINCLLDQKDLAKTAGSGEACTSIVTEYRYKRPTDHATYTVEIDGMDNTEIEEILLQSVVDYRTYHLRDRDQYSEDDEEMLREKAKFAWDTLKAFQNHATCTEETFRDSTISVQELQRRVLEWKDVLVWPEGFNAGRTVWSFDGLEVCLLEMDEIPKIPTWRFIKVIRTGGIVLVDLPGFRDINTARVRVAERMLYQCDEIFIVTPILRAATDAGVENIMQRQLGNNFDGLRRSQGVAIICTKTEDIGLDSEMLRDIPNTREFNTMIVRGFEHDIKEAMEDDRPTKVLEARKKQLFISARNQHVRGLVMTHYTDQTRDRRFDVFCISSNLYRDGYNEQHERHRRQSSQIIDKIEAAAVKIDSSRILELRDFCRGIPSHSQIAETRHFLNTKLVTLLEKAEIWLTGSVETALNQQATPGALELLQEDLKTHLHVSVEEVYDGLSDSRNTIIRGPMAHGMNRWEREAVVKVDSWERWNVGTWGAFWNRQGAHVTVAQPVYTDWNKEILRAMVVDLERAENSIRSECDTLFTGFKESANGQLTTLLERLGEFHGVEVFARTFPRRRRTLDYEVDNVTTSFYNELQYVFHDLLNTHSTSYVMTHMAPMYNESFSGDGKRKRLISRFKLQITGDRTRPRLFERIRDLFTAAINSLIERTHAKLRRAVDQCCEDIGNDLGLLRGEDVPGAGVEEDNIAAMFDRLEDAKMARNAVGREFEAGLRVAT